MSNVGQPSILMIRSGRHEGRLLTLPQGDVVIGRDESCRIRLGSSDVSRRHCVLRSTADGIVAEDLGSRNGTHVNDVRIEGPTVLRPGDVIRVGPLVFEVPRPDTSEDEIADWLSGVEDTTSPGDTTILPGLRGRQVPPPAKDEFDSIAEEAADIIRRHRLMQEQDNESE